MRMEIWIGLAGGFAVVAFMIDRCTRTRMADRELLLNRLAESERRRRAAEYRAEILQREIDGFVESMNASPFIMAAAREQ